MTREAMRLLAIGLLVGGMTVYTQAASLQYDYNAALDTAGNGTWENELTATVVRTWTFAPAGSYSPTGISSSATDFTQAYVFGSGLTGATAGTFGSSDITGAAAAFEFWIKPDDLAGNELLFETGGATHGAAVLLEGSNLRFATRNANANFDVTVPLTAGETSDFVQVVGVVDPSSGQTAVYINGIARSVTAGTKNWAQGTDNSALGTKVSAIGGINSGDNGNYGDFEGQIAQMRFYNGAISGMEVAAAFADHSTVAPETYASVVGADNPVAYYRFGEQAGSQGVVSYGSAAGVGGNDKGAGVVTHDTAALAPGTSTGAVHFDGGSYIELTNNDAINTAAAGYSQKTIELWFNADSVPGAGNHAVLYEQGGTTNGLSVYLSDDKVYMGGWANNGSGKFVNASVTAGETYFLQMTWDAVSGELLGWLNGGLVGLNSGTNLIPIHTGVIGIGAANADTRYHDGTFTGTGDYYTGTIDELALYNTALTRASAQAAYIARGGDLGITNGATLGMLINYDAGVGAGDSLWEETTGHEAVNNTVGALDWNMTGATRQTGVSNYQGITAAFEFTTGTEGVYPGGTAADSWHDLVLGDPTDGDATIELWFKPDDLTGKEVLFETGGSTTGASIRLNGDLLELAVKYSSDPAVVLSFDLDADNNGIDFEDFIQVAAVLDLTNDILRLYVHGIERTTSVFNGLDWDGGDAASIGNIEGAIGASGSGYGQYFGQLAILRLYDQALNTGQIQANYEAITGAPVPEPASFTVLALSSLALMRRRRA
jgi:hypothetical protein